MFSISACAASSVLAVVPMQATRDLQGPCPHHSSTPASLSSMLNGLPHAGHLNCDFILVPCLLPPSRGSRTQGAAERVARPLALVTCDDVQAALFTGRIGFLRWSFMVSSRSVSRSRVLATRSLLLRKSRLPTTMPPARLRSSELKMPLKRRLFQRAFAAGLDDVARVRTVRPFSRVHEPLASLFGAIVGQLDVGCLHSSAQSSGCRW